MLLEAAAVLPMLLIQQDSAPAPKPTPVAPFGNPGTWVTDDDYPAKALAGGEFGTIRFRLVVDEKGKVARCNILRTSGFAELDQHTCAVMLIRAKFKPARDAAGTPVAGLYEGSFTWMIPGGGAQRLLKEEVPPLGIDLSLNRLPKDYIDAALLRVHFARSGKPDACRVEQGTGNAMLDKIACEQAMAQATPPEERIRGGLKPDTRMVIVSFAAGQAKPE